MEVLTMSGKAGSVIIVTHNQSRVLNLQLQALSRQRHVRPGEFEVIVTDDGSSDDERGRNVELTYASPLRPMFLTQDTDRFWASRARNRAMDQAEGTTLILLDGDMVPEDELVASHLARHANTDRLILAGNRCRRPAFGSRAIQDFWRDCRTYQSGGVSKLDVWQASEETYRAAYAASAQSWRVIFSAHMSVRNVPEMRFDESFRGWGPEDWELAYRLVSRHGYTTDYAPEILAYEVDALGDGVGNLFRVRTQQSIVDGIRNTLYFHDLCPALTAEESMWMLRKLRLVNDQWEIISPADTQADMVELEQRARAWLAKEGIYTAPKA
jgi:glycosyltransferase involved in cell wall biosynthesis